MLSRPVRVVFFVSALIVFGISLAVHLASKMQVAMPGGVMVIHALAILLFGSGVVGKVALSGSGSGSGSGTGRRGLFEDVPLYLRGVMGLIVVYAVLNFMWSMGGVGNGQPHMEDGQYYISGRDVPRREITEQEYRALSAKIQSAFSGYWLVFLAGAALLWYPAQTSGSDG